MTKIAKMNKNVTVEWWSSNLVDIGDYSDYITDYFGKIFIRDMDSDSDSLREEVGSFRLRQVLAGLALNDGFPDMELYDSEYSIMDVMGHIYDFEEGDLKVDTNGSDILIIERIELLPEYRGNRYGEIALKEIIRRFFGSVAIIAVKPFPLQFEVTVCGSIKGNIEKNRYGLLEKNRLKAYKKLCNFYKKCGFRSYKGIKEIMIINTADTWI